MKQKKIWIAAVILLAALAVILWALLKTPGPAEDPAGAAVQTAQPETITAEAAAEAEEQTAAPETNPETEQTAAPATEKEIQEQPFLVQITDNDPSIAYVLVRMPDPIGLLPLPVEGEYTRTIRRTMADGTEAINVVHLTPNGFWMEDANCEGHDCVNEGEVTLENREERVLWNMVICLPHQLSLELITRDEAMSLLGQ